MYFRVHHNVVFNSNLQKSILVRVITVKSEAPYMLGSAQAV